LSVVSGPLSVARKAWSIEHREKGKDEKTRLDSGYPLAADSGMTKIVRDVHEIIAARKPLPHSWVGLE
jgi:hypothetical protein